MPEIRTGRPVRLATLAMAILATFAIELAVAEAGRPPLAVLAAASGFFVAPMLGVRCWIGPARPGRCRSGVAARGRPDRRGGRVRLPPGDPIRLGLRPVRLDRQRVAAGGGVDGLAPEPRARPGRAVVPARSGPAGRPGQPIPGPGGVGDGRQPGGGPGGGGVRGGRGALADAGILGRAAALDGRGAAVPAAGPGDGGLGGGLRPGRGGGGGRRAGPGGDHPRRAGAQLGRDRRERPRRPGRGERRRQRGGRERGPRSIGFTESEVYLESDRPSLYDSFSDQYGEPIKPKGHRERMVALAPQESETKDRPTENLRAGRTFPTARRRPVARPAGGRARGPGTLLRQGARRRSTSAWRPTTASTA